MRSRSRGCFVFRGGGYLDAAYTSNSVCSTNDGMLSGDAWRDVTLGALLDGDSSGTGTLDGNVTFDDVANCALEGRAGYDDGLVTFGYYYEALQRWTKHVDRKNLLVLNYDTLDKEPYRALTMVSNHYGVPTSSSCRIVPSPHQSTAVP